MERARAAASRLERTQLALLGVLLALAVVAWLVTQDRMGGMESVPGEPRRPGLLRHGLGRDDGGVMIVPVGAPPC